MLPKDIENLILEYHDAYGTIKNRFHVNLVIKSGCAEYRHVWEERWGSWMHYSKPSHMIACIHKFDKRMTQILNYKKCYSQLWPDYVPWEE